MTRKRKDKSLAALGATNEQRTCLTAYRTSVRLPHRSTAQNCEKTRIARSEVKRLARLKIENFHCSSVTQTVSLPSVIRGIQRYPRCNSTDSRARKCSESNTVPVTSQKPGVYILLATDLAPRRKSFPQT